MMICQTSEHKISYSAPEINQQGQADKNPKAVVERNMAYLSSAGLQSALQSG